MKWEFESFSRKWCRMTTLTSLYISGDYAFLHSNQQTMAGFWIPCAPYIKVDKAA